MEKVLKLQIITPEKIALDQEINSLVVPAFQGLMGILPNHAPLVTGLHPGVLKYTKEEEEHFFFVSEGFLEVAKNTVTILADAAEKPREIDVERAREAKVRAQKRLKKRAKSLDVARARLALQRAIARIRAAEHRE